MDVENDNKYFKRGSSQKILKAVFVMNVLDQKFDCGNGDELVCVHLSSRLSPFSYVYHGLSGLNPRFRYINWHTVYAHITDLKILQEHQILVMYSCNPLLLIDCARLFNRRPWKAKLNFFSEF